MEETIKREHISLINELIQGKELAKQLCNHLVSSSSPTSSLETNEFLIDKILSSYEKALTMLKWGSNVGETNTTHDKNKPVFKKRKTMHKWTEQVKICSTTGLEGCLDDGYNWRKYGQKDILGTTFPRGYYRCTQRNIQGCLATKQVQRSDEDPSLIEITYRGRHTCTQAKHSNKAFPSKLEMGFGENQLHNDQKEKIEPTPETMFAFKTEELGTKNDIFPQFCFPSPPIGSENEDNNILSETMMDNNFMESFYPAFISPATSESNIFCLSPPCNMGSTELVQNVQTSESDITETVSAPTSVTNSPIMDLDIILDKGVFDIDFHSNILEYFSS